VVENVSMQSATHWGIHLQQKRNDSYWTLQRKDSGPLTEATCIRGEQLILLPAEKTTVVAHLKGRTERAEYYSFFHLWEKVGISLRPVSQNHVGREFVFGWADRSDWDKNSRRLTTALEEHGHRVKGL
jgi:hypothetical protein